VVQARVIDVVDHDPRDDRATACREQRSSRPILVLSIHCASQATTFSKSLICRASGRRWVLVPVQS
jgi:hypothetical protein